MDGLKTSIWVGAALAIAAAGPAEAKSTVAIAGNVEVTTAQAGVDAATLLTADAAKSAIESKLQWAEACGDVPQEAKHEVVLSVDGNGAVTGVERKSSSLEAAFATCLDGVLAGVRTAALPTPEASVKVVVALTVTPVAAPATAAAPAPAPAPAPAAAPAEAAAPPASPLEQQKAQGTPSSADTQLTEAKAPSKAWKVGVDLNLSLGQGTFVQDSFAAAPYFGYAFTVRGSYKVLDWLSASIRFDLDQQLTQTNQDAESGVPNQFFFRETRIGVATSGLYKEAEYTGIEADASFSLRLPTDLASQAAGRVFGAVIGGSLSRTFEKVGPGDLRISYALSYRENIGPRAPNLKDIAGTSFALCRSSADACTGPANTARQLTNGFTLEYSFLEKFTATVDLTIRNDFRWALNNSELPAHLAGARHSNNSIDAVNQLDLVFGTIELAYAIDDMFAVAAGISNISEPFILGADGTYSFKFPWFDTESAALNLTTYYLTFGFSY